MTNQELAAPRQILRGTVGSTVHGLNIVGQDDRDEMGICWEPIRYVIGFQKFEQWIHRTQPEGVRSGPGDLDLTVYSLRKYCQLALGGNPSVLLLMFLPEYSVKTIWGLGLINNRKAFFSQHAIKAFLGYMTAQRLRLLGLKGQKDIKRPELVEAYGFDTKFAMHMLRLGMQGLEYARTGNISLPMPEYDREYLRKVRTGGISLEYCAHHSKTLEAELLQHLTDSNIPEQPNTEQIERYVITCYQEMWKELVL